MPEEETTEEFEGEADDSTDLEAELEALATDADGAPIEEEAEGKPTAVAEEPPEEPEAPDPIAAAAAKQNEGILTELANTRREMSTMRERMQQLVEALSEAGQEPPAPPPSFDADPEGSIKNMVTEAVAPVVETQKAQQEEQDQAALDEFSEAANTFVENDRNTFLETHPDLQDAEDFLREKDIAQVKFQFPRATDEQVAAHLIQTKYIPLQLAYYKSRQSIAAAVYEQAKTMGWVPGNGAKPAGKPSRVTPAQMRAKKQQARNVGETPPGSPRKVAKVKDLLALTDDEYADYIAEQKNPKKAEDDLAKSLAVEL